MEETVHPVLFEPSVLLTQHSQRVMEMNSSDLLTQNPHLH